MKKFFMAALIAAALSMPALASADDDVIDLSKITCTDFRNLSDNERCLMFFWMDGYMSAKSDNTKISTAWMVKLGDHIGTYCSTHPGKTIMDAMEAFPAE